MKTIFILNPAKFLGLMGICGYNWLMDTSIIQEIAIWALPVIFAITLHEVAHGWVASFFGDQTARLSGRLTINPVKHIDLVGTILVPLLMLTFSHFIFGWAKPVPVDSRNMRNPKWNMVLVALAGPLANLVMAIFWALIAKIGFMLADNEWLSVPLVLMGRAGIMINIVLGVLNCLPIPPLDGGRVLYSLVSGKSAWYLYKFEPYGIVILLLLMVSGLLSLIIGPPIMFLIGSIMMLFNL
jgi:Zn-dependent protease